MKLRGPMRTILFLITLLSGLILLNLPNDTYMNKTILLITLAVSLIYSYLYGIVVGIILEKGENDEP